MRPSTGWLAHAQPSLRVSLHPGKQSAHTLLGFVLFWVLLALMVFLGLAGLGAGGFPLGFGGLLRLVRPAGCFLSWTVLCCSCSLSSHCWEAVCKHDCQIHLTPLCCGTHIRIKAFFFFYCRTLIMTTSKAAAPHC